MKKKSNGILKPPGHVATPPRPRSVNYILYSPAHDVVREAFTRPDGTFVPEKVFTTEARALYRLRGLPDRRYRSSYPVPVDKDMYLAKFRSVKEAIREREALADYCGEEFEIRQWKNGVLGEIVEPVLARRSGNEQNM